MSSYRRRPVSPYWDGNSGDRDNSPSKFKSDFTRSLVGLIDKFAGQKPDPSNPVVGGASTHRPWLRGRLAEFLTQLPRTEANIRLMASIADTQFLDGGLADDKEYQMEKIIQLAASFPTDSQMQNDLSSVLIKALWNNLQHPPLSMQGPEYRYRAADGSNNNIMYPNLGKAGSSYARTVTPKTLQPGVLPDPGVVFDAIYARGSHVHKHPSRISSMLFYLAAIIIHDIFHTDPRDSTKLKTSSYLDLAPLYGSNISEQEKVRSFEDGKLKPDTFSEGRILGFPPGVSALLICFNRYHNYVAIQLKEINEGGRFTPPKDPQNQAALGRLDEDIFQTARLITCGLYVNIILNDYVRTILNLNRVHSTWSLDPRENSEFFSSIGAPEGIGNQVSVEFNLVYRWHSATSLNDERWTEEAYRKLFPEENIEDLTEEDFQYGLRTWLSDVGDDPSQWPIDLGRHQRNERGAFPDELLVRLLQDATEDEACAFGPRQVPVVMKLIEVMGIKQAREWNVCTLNEFRRHMSLEPHKTFADFSSDPDVQHALKALYKHPDYVELYPGLVAEDAKASMTPGSGICLGFTTSRTILADAVALVRGDRFYTIDYSPANLTNWGFNQIKSDGDVAQGHCIYNLIMRALPGYYRGNSVYAMFPFVVPEENRSILEGLGMDKDYSFDRPTHVPIPKAIRSWQGVVDVLSDPSRFKVPWGEHITYLTGQDYMLGNDSMRSAKDHKRMDFAIHSPLDWSEQIRKFYEVLTRQLILIGQEQLRDDRYQLDICRDVAQPAHSVFVAKMWHIPLKAKGDDSIGVEVDKMYLAMSLMFAYVFLDADTTRSFRLRKAAKEATDQLTKLSKIVCKAIKEDGILNISKLFHMGEEGQTLEGFGRNLILRLFDYGWDLDTVVANLLPTAVAAAATQTQHMTQMIDLYLSDEYKEHWPRIQELARSEDPRSFELLKAYAREANRLAPASYGLLRKVAEGVQVQDGTKNMYFEANESVYLDFLSAGRDHTAFPDPEKIILDRPWAKYIHHGWGMHSCIGRQIVETSMAAQLKVFGQLKNLKRAPGPQGRMKFTYPKPNPVSSDPVDAPGHVRAFMKEDWGDFWPFPTTLKVHHQGFVDNDATMRDAINHTTGLPNARAQVIASSQENSRSRSASRHHSRGRSEGRNSSQNLVPPGMEPPSMVDNLTTRLSNDRQSARTNSDEDDLAFGDEGELRTVDRADMNGFPSGETPSIAVNGERHDRGRRYE